MKIEDPFLSSLGINWEMIFVQTQGKVVERPCRRNRTFYKITDGIKMRVIIWIFRFTLKERNSQDELESLEL